MSNDITVLVVEDNQDDAELMILELELSGFVVEWQRTENPEEFVNALTTDVDIVLADYNLPQFSAPEALDLLQKMGFDTPFIVVTGSISEEVAVSCMKMGAADYLIKDRLSRLGEAVRLSLQQRDLRRAQEKTERDLMIMNRAIDTSLNGVVMADLDGRVNYVNQAFLELVGIQDEAQLLHASLEEFWPDNDEIKQLTRLVREGQHVQGEMPTIREATGQKRILQYAAGLVRDDDGQPLRMMGIFIDITEQKQAEKARQEAEILRIQLEKERELRELKTRFVSMVVHDFRNPVSAIKLALDLLQKYDNKLGSKKREEKIEMMLTQTKHLNQLIDDVLMIDRMETVTTEFRPVQDDIITFGRALLDEFIKGVETQKYEICFVCAESPPLFVLFDKSLLHRALINLLSNAVKYSPEGGTIKLDISATESEVILAVSDTGIGIPPEDQKRLYEGFHRAGNVGMIPGSGLGLAIVKQIVDVHAGAIACESELNVGTTFSIKLPR